MSRYRVCVADDCEETAAVLQEGLQLHGYEACVAHTGEKALELCEAGGVDLILLDVCLPGMDGYEVCRRLKAGAHTRDIVVVFVTVRRSNEDISRGYSLGAADYITKPYNLPMVMLRVDAAIRNRKLEDPMGGHEELLFDVATTDPLTGLRNRSYLMSRLAEELDKAHRYDFPVSCLMIDVSEVHAVDDELGPSSLDDLLVEIAMALKTFTRSNDILARFDGTVFAAVLPHTPLKDAVNYASKILDGVEGMTFSEPCSPTRAKLSVGLAAVQNGATRAGKDVLLGEAMKGLLQAKSVAGERLVARQTAEA